MPAGLAEDLCRDSAVTLSRARVGCDLRIRMVEGPACGRLRDMGFCEQLQVRKLADGRILVCTLCGVRMAISRDLAEQVWVEAVA
jgi:ferrous iron transport protein A